MSRHDPPQHRRDEILHEIAELGPMRKGSLCERLLPWKTAQGRVKRRGLYWYYP